MEPSLRPTLGALALALASVLLSPSPAPATRSTHGADYSFDFNARTYLGTCDRESDSTPVKGDYDVNNTGSISGSVRDSDGANGSCASKATGVVIRRHKTCEYRAFWPDECDSWVAT